jgi:hypothetical protein
MDEIYRIFRELKLPDEIINLIVFKHRGIQHPDSIRINNKINMIYIKKPFYYLDYIKSYMWGLDRSLNILNAHFCCSCNKFVMDIVYLESIKEHRRIFNNTIYTNDKFEYSYVYYLNKLYNGQLGKKECCNYNIKII